MTRYGIRLRRPWWPKGRWKRGEQFRRANTKSGWTYWRRAWPSEKSAKLRLKAYHALGWRGHTFKIDPDGYNWLEVEGDTKLPHPKLARILDEAGRKCGRVLLIKEGTRTRARQQELWNANPNPMYVARPGTSNHEDHNSDGWGIAADVVDAIDGESLRPMLERRNLMEWLEYERAFFPMKHEPWHIELIGVPR